MSEVLNIVNADNALKLIKSGKRIDGRSLTDFRNIAGSKYTEISGFNTLGFNGNGGIRFTF